MGLSCSVDEFADGADRFVDSWRQPHGWLCAEWIAECPFVCPRTGDGVDVRAVFGEHIACFGETSVAVTIEENIVACITGTAVNLVVIQTEVGPQFLHPPRIAMAGYGGDSGNDFGQLSREGATPDAPLTRTYCPGWIPAM